MSLGNIKLHHPFSQCLIESTNEACYMYQISSQSDELCREVEGGGVRLTPPLKASCNYFF